MDNITLIVIAAIVVIVLLGGFVLMQRRRSDQLKSQFGPEYDRAVDQVGNKRKAEAELNDRAKRVEKLSIKPLEEGRRDRFIKSWQDVQAEFVDDPEKSIRDADLLLQDVMTARGYPVQNFDQAAADLSVDHPTVVQHYRKAHDIAVRHREGDTEALREAMVDYRKLFDELVSERSDNSSPSQPIKEDS